MYRLKSNRTRIAAVLAFMCLAVVIVLFLRPHRQAHFSHPLRIGFGNEEPAHFLGQDGQPTGYAVAVLNEAAKRAGIELQWIHTTETPDQAIASNHVDLWPLVAIVPERLGHMYFSKPWHTITYHITSRKNNPISPDHIPASFTVAIRPSNIERFITTRNFPQARMIPVASRGEAFSSVCTGRADAVLTSQPFDEIKKRPECENASLQVASLADGLAYFGIGANLRSPDAVRAADALRAQMAAMADDQSLSSTIFRWSYRDGAEIAGLFSLLEAQRHARLLVITVILLAFVLVLLALLALRFIERTKALQREASERNKAEQALIRSEEDFRSLIQNAPCGIYRASFKEDRFISVNPSLVKTLRYSSAEELLRVQISRDLYVHPEDRNALFDSANSREIFGREVEWRRSDETTIKVRLVGRMVHETKDGDKIAQFLAEDVTDRSLLEEQLRQSQKMDAVGRLAGGVAHDFNNILAIILGHSELLQILLDKADPTRKRIDQIIEAATRGSALTQQLLAYSRKQVLKTEILNINAVLNNVAQLLQRVIGEDIDLVLHFRPDVGCINSDRSRMEQVLLNLAINARDAMPKGGTLTLETQNVELDDFYRHLYPGAPAGRYVKFAVRDTGCGISPEALNHLFEPFFTTKPHGKGTGLGLSTVYGIVRQSGGFINVKSEVGRGTTVEILLPRIIENESDQKSASSGPQELARSQSHETVLIVEDEKELLQLSAEVLEALGYKVLTASDGYQAIQTAEAHEGRIDLLLTDVIMPGMGGWDLSKALRNFSPSLKVLFMSGYTNGIIAKHGVLESGTFLLEKPFKAADLAARVRELLDVHESRAVVEDRAITDKNRVPFG